MEIPANGQVIHGLSDLCLFSNLLSTAVNFIKPFVSWDLETGRKVGICLACHFHAFKFGVFPTLQMGKLSHRCWRESALVIFSVSSGSFFSFFFFWLYRVLVVEFGI